MRLSTIVESQEYRKDSVILAAGRKSASRVYVVHTGTVHITAMNEVPERSMPEFEDAVDGSHVHRLGAGSVFGLAGRPSPVGSALAMTEVFVLAFDRVKLAATIQAIYEEIGRVAMRSPRMRQATQAAAEERGSGEGTAEGSAGAAGGASSPGAVASASVGPDYAELEQVMQCAAVRADATAHFMSETSVFRGWAHEALVELSWFGYVIDVSPNQQLDPPAMFVRGGCLGFVMSGQIQLKTRGSGQVSATITAGNFFGENALRQRITGRPVEKEPAATKKGSKFAAAVRRTGILSAPEPHAADLKVPETGVPLPTTVLVLDAQDLQLLCDHRTLVKVEAISAIVRKTRAAATKRQSTLFNALQAGVGELGNTVKMLEAQRMADIANGGDDEDGDKWREPAGGVTARGAYQTALLRAQHRKLNPKSPRAPIPPVEVFRKVERSFAHFRTGVSSAYVLLEAMPIEAMTQLQDSSKRIEEKVQSEFLIPLMENLKAQQDNPMAQATARGVVGRWKAATKASTPRDWLLQLDNLLQHTQRELDAVRPAARLAQPTYDWVAAKGLCKEVEESIMEAGSLLHKLMLRKPETQPKVRRCPAALIVKISYRYHSRCWCEFVFGQAVLTEAQTATLDEACEVADTAIGEEYKCIVHETAQKLGLTSAAVRDYFFAKKRLVGPELVRRCRLLARTRVRAS
jgi:hypothetical protein